MSLFKGNFSASQVNTIFLQIMIAYAREKIRHAR
jgi:hypothetical protein